MDSCHNMLTVCRVCWNTALCATVLHTDARACGIASSADVGCKKGASRIFAV
jgi:hypothetical protein